MCMNKPSRAYEARPCTLFTRSSVSLVLRAHERGKTTLSNVNARSDAYRDAKRKIGHGSLCAAARNFVFCSHKKRSFPWQKSKGSALYTEAQRSVARKCYTGCDEGGFGIADPSATRDDGWSDLAKNARCRSTRARSGSAPAAAFWGPPSFLCVHGRAQLPVR